MTTHWLRALSSAKHRNLALALTVVGALCVSATGCGGGSAGGFTPLAQSQTDRRPLPAAFTSRPAVSYSPYRTSATEADLSREVITPANVLQDLLLIRATGIGTIRLFSSRGFSETVLKVIRDNKLDLRVYLGAYPNPVSNAAEEADNQAELDQCILLANRYADLIDAVSVGNEVMVDFSTHKVPVAVMATYLQKVRNGIKQPVTTDDNWAFWAAVPKVIAEVVDFASVHTYPLLDTFYDPTLWDWRLKTTAPEVRAQAMITAAANEAKRQFAQSQAAFDKLNLPDFPMIVGETGWTAVDVPGGPSLAFRAHPVNQRLYFEALQSWAADGRRTAHGPKSIIYFEAFDETWKGGDDGWGLFNKNREARYVIQGLGTCGVTWACEAGSYTVADAVKWTAPVVTAAINAPRYTLYAEATVAGEVRASGLRWDPFGFTAYRDDNSTAAPGDGNLSFEITPNPLNYGWGLFLYSGAGATANLSSFANGKLNFSIKSDSYPGKIEIGISTDTEDRDIQEAYLQIGPGERGYCNTNNWCQVSVPISAFVAANPKLDLRLVNFRFIIADRFSFTGKPLNTTNLPKVRIDGVYWSP